MKKMWFVEGGPDTRHPINVSVHNTYKEAKEAYENSTDRAKRLHSLEYTWKLCSGVNPKTIKQEIY